ncbi:TetR family transcriptional regulator [Mycolicibacterium psychrotolerans]|uniref:TetR family transcriptional regulator n=1 Tax=Mycolicibacterium psychrotolerans TaxID=216929 RepID=A0A7I7M5P5_9MYCO|nr:TetR family transcriptional regulator [Mycolicibacterium psychrotolerans]
MVSPFSPSRPLAIVTPVSTPSVGLPEQHSTKAARLLAAASDLLIGRGARGFTVADVAQRAHVGKGTVYLYWPTKEDLLIGLLGRGFLGLLDDLIRRLGEEPDLARPSRFCPTMLDVATSQPLLAALQRHDENLLGVLADHPRSVALHDALGPSAVIGAVLPVWRRHGMARTDWETADQAFALHGLVTGIALSLVGPAPGPRPADSPLNVLSVAVTALLGPERATQKQVRSAATEIIKFLDRGRDTALELIA